MAYTDPNTVQDPTSGERILSAWGDQIRTNQEDHEGRIAGLDSDRAFGAAAGDFAGVAGSNTLAPGENVLFLVPLWFPEEIPIDRLECEVTTAQAGTQVRLGMWNKDVDTLLGSVTVDTTTTGVKGDAAALAIPAGRSWWGVVAQGSATTPTLRSLANIGWTGLIPSSANNLFAFCGTKINISGALPANPKPFTSAGNNMPAIRARVA